MNKRLLSIILTISFGFNVFSSAFASFAFAQTSSPQNQEKTITKKWIEVIKKGIEKILLVWKAIHQKIMKWWKENILPKIQERFREWLERKKTIIKKEFEKEKEEFKKEVKKDLSKLWKEVKDLISK